MKDQTLTIRLSEAERKALNTYAKEAGVKPSTLARHYVTQPLKLSNDRTTK